ncbi:glycoside hydrolase [Marinobacter vulgaris]|uniref:Glycoside hydrolase n=1 Tax=Marinobacter vulgaris TaxID=1928331 RepID=A0A2V3ZLN6_9GAMM|nr:NlpC/P60 family protein [Marinobacter vulgaris]PXX90365.1 glycoside hydrolase [Marinobacter vulgaris]TSJ69609.1 NlpC/P60 family protein [Marinobacter vulgaris]
MNRRTLVPFLTVFVALSLVGCASNQSLRPATETDWQPPGEVSGDSARAGRLWQVFERYQGTPYRYGGTSASGFDCSGFIATAFDEALGRQLPRTTSQMLAAGDVVERDQLRAGDLVFFRIKGKDQHAGIYMGGETFIHSSSSIGVTHSSLNGYYWRDRFSQARRFD